MHKAFSVLVAVVPALALSALVAGCAAPSDAEEDSPAESTDQALTAGGTLACTVVDPKVVNTLAVVCDALGHCVLFSKAPRAASGVNVPLTVISARGGTITMSSAAAQVQVVMRVKGSKPTAAAVYSATGLVATCL
jgi:hypothetical protein